ncbi:hypothetical protein BHE74_00042235 [Ensete ventricosum]|nr:hypothetical protein BHE74_00042235 [Ensete ventricosum]
MLQERPSSNPNLKHPSRLTHVPPSTLQTRGLVARFPAEEVNATTPMPNHYWRRLFNDPGFTPSTTNPGPPVVLTEAFLSLTQQVQALAGMM